MKVFERIFLYSILVVLMFYVFLVDGNVESKVFIQEEIKARRIVIVNDEGREVVLLSASGESDGAIIIYNKDGAPVVIMRTTEYGNGDIVINNKDGASVAGMGADENDNGSIGIFNKSGEIIGSLP